MSNLLTDLMENIPNKEFSKHGTNLTKKTFGLLLEGMAGNVSNKKGEIEKIMGTLDKEHNDGTKILNHIFGDQKDKIIDSFAKKEKISSRETSSLFETLAPVFMNSLSKSKNKVNADSNVLGELIKMSGKVLAKDKGNSLISLLDKNKNGSILDEIFNFIIKFIKNKK